ncbi:hypothetical protein, partial [Actinacidiphila glaucinigra]
PGTSPQAPHKRKGRPGLRPGRPHNKIFSSLLAEKLNNILAKDGFELYPTEYISGLPIYAGGPRASFHGARPDLKFESRPLLTDPRVLHEHQERIRAGLERDPAAGWRPA